MVLTTNPTSEAFRQSVGDFLATCSPEGEVRRLMATSRGHDPRAWSDFATATGAVALEAPQSSGGRGGSFLETVSVLEESGRVLFCAPLLSSVTAVHVALQAPPEDPVRTVLCDLSRGAAVATVAVLEDDGDQVPRLLASPDGRSAQGYLLNGVKSYVLDGHTCDRLVVVARDGDEVAFFDVATDAAGLQRSLLPTLDQTRKLARLVFGDVPARRIRLVRSGQHGLDRLLDLTRVALAAEQLGGARTCLDLAVDHARARQQFGRPIGSFQALKHTCAGLLAQIESARSVVAQAARAVDQGSVELATLSQLARSLASQAYLDAAGANMQIRGGTGFTWDDCAHLHLKRAKSASLLLGDVGQQRQQLAALLGLVD